jgi:hypothetical protein
MVLRAEINSIREIPQVPSYGNSTEGKDIRILQKKKREGWCYHFSANAMFT